MGAVFDSKSGGTWGEAAGTWAGWVRNTPATEPEQVYAWAFDALLVEGVSSGEPGSVAAELLQATGQAGDVPPHGNVAHKHGWTIRRGARLLAWLLTGPGPANPDRNKIGRAKMLSLAREVVRAAVRLDPDDSHPGPGAQTALWPFDDEGTSAPLAQFFRGQAEEMRSYGATWSAEWAEQCAARFMSSEPMSLPSLTNRGKDLVEKTVRKTRRRGGWGLGVLLGALAIGLAVGNR